MPTPRGPDTIRAGSLALLALLAAATPATAQDAATPASPLHSAVAALGAVDVGVAWQVTEFDINSESELVTTRMTNGFEPTPLLRAQIPVRMLWESGGNGIGYLVRGGYRRFELKLQDLGGMADEQADYGTRVRGHALFAMPFLVARLQRGDSELSTGLGLGLGQMRARGDVLVRRTTATPPFFALAREAVDVDAWTSVFGAFLEYRIGHLVAGMETAIFNTRQGGRDYDLGLSAFTLGWRIDF
jgi:hypothetical protein